MKLQFIFILGIFLFLYSCSSSNQQAASEGNISISGSFQYWYTSVPAETEFSEKGIDLRIEFYPEELISKPLYIIFNERKSFPASVTKSENNEIKLLIKARIILESSLLHEISEFAPHSDRLVYHDEDGSLQYAEINNWEKMPDLYK